MSPAVLAAAVLLSAAASAEPLGAMPADLTNLTAHLQLTTVAADGTTGEHQLVTSSRSTGPETRLLVRLLQPAAVSGTAFLAVACPAERRLDVSLYEPKLRRVRKVALSEKSRAFFDTDFWFGDFSADATDSVYGGVQRSVDPATGALLSADFTDKAGRPWKRYRTQKLATFRGRVMPVAGVMENLQTGTRTSFVITALDDAGPAEAFSERALERG